ncbi:MAG TPA: DUF4296 domain-containing protein [Phaeodactylibacter sp.]|nr:DUF4296 domain-containing protein [Phaeodactylibacter sp.]
MKKLTVNFLGLLLLLLPACRSEKKQTTPLPMPEEKLVQVLTDVHLAEVAGQNLLGPARDSLETEYYRQIFRIHQADSAAFFQSLNILLKEPERAKEIYEKVLENLARIETAQKDHARKSQ